MGTKVDRMAHVLRFRQYPSHNEVAPGIGTVDVFLAFPGATSLPCQISRWGLYLIPVQNVGNIAQAVPFNSQLVDTPHNCRRFLVNQPMILVVGVFSVAVNSLIGGRLARFTFDPDGSALFPAQIAQVPLGHDIDKRGKLTRAGIVAVNAVPDGNEVDTVAFENNLCVKARLEIISPHPAEVLDQKMFYLPGLNVGNQSFPCGTVKIAARPSVIRVMDDITVTVVSGIALQVSFLIDDRITVP